MHNLPKGLATGDSGRKPGLLACLQYTSPKHSLTTVRLAGCTVRYGFATVTHHSAAAGSAAASGPPALPARASSLTFRRCGMVSFAALQSFWKVGTSVGSFFWSRMRPVLAQQTAHEMERQTETQSQPDTDRQSDNDRLTVSR